MLKNKNLKPPHLDLALCLLGLAVGFGILHFIFTTISSAEEQFAYNAKGKRDPFVSLVTPDGRLLSLDKEEDLSRGLSLEGIMYDKHGVSYAVVNAKVVKVGDEVSGYQVLKIEKEKVIFIKDSQPTVVELKKEGL